MANRELDLPHFLSSRTAEPSEAEGQTRSVGMIMQSSDYDAYTELNPFTQNASNPKKWHRCVNKVKRKGGANPYAVCAKLR